MKVAQGQLRAGALFIPPLPEERIVGFEGSNLQLEQYEVRL